jgi:hypothetical protein
MDELIKHTSIDCTTTSRTYNGRELPAFVTGVNLYDVFAPNWVMSDLGTAGQMLTLPQARVQDIEPYSQRDIAAFRVAPSAPVKAARLATAPPAVGEPAFLAVNKGPGTSAGCSHRDGGGHGTNLHPSLRERRKGPAFTSGAPLLNRAGEVVGINIGCGKLDGQQLGHGNHVTSMRRHLGW